MRLGNLGGRGMRGRPEYATALSEGPLWERTATAFRHLATRRRGPVGAPWRTPRSCVLELGLFDPPSTRSTSPTPLLVGHAGRARRAVLVVPRGVAPGAWEHERCNAASVSRKLRPLAHGEFGGDSRLPSRDVPRWPARMPLWKWTGGSSRAHGCDALTRPPRSSPERGRAAPRSRSSTTRSAIAVGPRLSDGRANALAARAARTGRKT